MTLRLNGSTSGYTEIDAPAVAGSNTLVLPGGNGSAGQVLTTNGSGALSWTGMGPAFSAIQTTAQTLSSGASTKLQFQTEQFDTANCFDSSSSYRFTPNVAGYYQINAAGYQLSSTQTELLLWLYKNGVAVLSMQNYITPLSRQVAGSGLIYMNGTTDFLEIYLYTSYTGALGVGSTFFQGFLARPA